MLTTYKVVSLTVLFSLLLFPCWSQNYLGYTVDNYAGVHAVSYNPAMIISTYQKTDINIASVSAFGGSDYFGIDVGSLISTDEVFTFDDDTDRFPNDNNDFFANADILGPSAMFRLNDKSSIGVITRVRGLFNLSEINGKLYENLVDQFENDEDFSFDSQNLSGTVHAWTEIGVSYGRVLLKKSQHELTGGITLKYLLGAGGLFASSPGLEGEFIGNTETLQTRGFLNYGKTQDFDRDNVLFDNLEYGLGLDLGFIYTWSASTAEDDVKLQNPYTLKVGVSVTDIGSINYNQAEITSYNLNASVSTTTFQEDIEEFLDNNYDSTADNQNARIQLPTALHILVDYHLTKKWFVSVQSDVSLVERRVERSNTITNVLTLSPRYETKWFGFYLPVSLRQSEDVVVGGGFRLGPLSVGSGSVFSNFLSNSSKTADLFVALKIPIYNK
ncbi:DUF5723 family protein [Winogradskyella sp.]|uniref:DUF5723 family protein n=1 Tax=Winogradskyella sp. TaxID=1883156 RepID=UPI00261875C4|nr:DUF5723 family protein [Winogradskyella sp.]